MISFPKYTGGLRTEEPSPDNKSSFSEFLLLPFSDVWGLQILHFMVFLVFYLAAATGNLLIISAVISDNRLRSPMYYFLMNLAIQDVGQVSVIFPTSMANSLMNDSHISYSGCVVQVLFHIFFLASDYFLLTVMAYDRYVAICNPLHYEMVMNRHACLQMVTAVWTIGLFYAVLHTGGTFASPFCSNVVNQFFCEIPHLLKLACSDLYLIEPGIILLSVFIVIGCFIFLVITYAHIFSVVLKISSVQKRWKAFSTCLPHLTVFSIFMFTVSFVYLKPTSNSPSKSDLVLTMVYSMIPPLINPLIYSIRNKEIKIALIKLVGLRH